MQDAGLPLLCHGSSMSPNYIHEFLPINPLNRDSDMGYSMCMSHSMNTGAFDTMSSLTSDEFSIPTFDLDASTVDAVSSSMSYEAAESQWTSSDASLIDGILNWDQTCQWEKEDTRNTLDGHQLPAFDPQTRNFSSSDLSESTSHSSPEMTCSKEGSSPPGSDYSSLMEDSASPTCRWDPHCESPLDPEKSEVSKHLQAVHDVKPGGDKTYMHCQWEGCGKHMKKESISRHIVAVHLSKKTECTGCGKKFARWDSKLRHVKNSKRECPDLESEQRDACVKRIRLSSESSS